MKIGFRLLIFSIAAIVYACHFGRHNRHESQSVPLRVTSTERLDIPLTEMPSTTNTLHITIIGGGPQMVAIVARFSTMKLQPGKKVYITVIETNPILGHGPTYDKKELLNEHLANNDGYFFDLMALPPTTPNSDFIKWMTDGRRDHYGIGQSLGEQIAFPPPRNMIGEYFIQRYPELKRACVAFGYTIVEKTEKTAVDVSRVGDKGFAVELDDTQRIYSQDLVLATGHWAESRFDREVKGYFKHPWPARKLQKEIPKGKKVVLFGGSQSAIDAAITESLDNGEFKETGKGTNVFTYERCWFFCKGFEITIYSRSGQFPAVRGWQGSVVKTPEFIADAAKLKDLNDRIKLDELFDLVIKKKFKDLYPDVSKIDGFEDATPEEFFDLLDGVLDKKDLTAQETLQQHADKARESLEKLAPMQIQSIASSMIGALDLHVRYLSTEDTIRAVEKIFPRFIKVSIPIPLRNAEMMLALMKANPPALKVVKVGDDCEVTPHSKQGVHLKCPGKGIDKHVPYFIDALGQSADITRSKSRLIKNMLRRKLIEPLRLELEVEESMQGAPEGEIRDQLAEKFGISKKKIEFDDKNGKFYYKAGGIEMNIDTFRAHRPVLKKVVSGADAEENLISVQDDIDDEGDAIYASGPFIYGRFPIAQSTRVSVMESFKIAWDFQRRYPKIFMPPEEVQA